jgi:acyl dehydratase
MVGGRRRRAVYSQRNTHTENVLELQHFEDLPLGGEWTTRRRTVTEADVTAFVALAGDYNPLYADVEHAKSTLFGRPVAPGAFVAALTTGLGSMDVPIPATVGLVGMSWKFLIPVLPGDTLGSRWRLTRKRNVENPRWGLAVWQVDVENQRGEVVASGEVARLVAKREQPAERSSRSRRRRRKGAPAGQSAADVVLAEPVPEPAPADLPPPSARRRRRRVVAEPVAEPGVAPAAVADASSEPLGGSAPEQARVDRPADQAGAAHSEPTPSKRRRRRRSSNGHDDGRPGGGAQGQGGGAQGEGGAPQSERGGSEGERGGPPGEGGRPPEVPVETSVPSSPPPARSSEPTPSPFSGGQRDPQAGSEPRQWSVEEQPPEGSDAGSPEAGGLGRVFRRLRRP